MVFNIFKDRLELFHMPEGGFVTRDIASVAFFPENKAEQFKQDTDDS